jgi:hypothetical protein
VAGRGFERRGAARLTGVGKDFNKFGGLGVTFAQKAGVQERGQRLGVEHDGNAAGDNRGEMFGPVCSQKRDVGQLQDFEDIEIIRFKREGESHSGKVSKGPLGLEREKRCVTALIFLELDLIRQKNPLTSEVGVGIEKVVDGLETEVTHPHLIFLRVDQGHGTAMAPLPHYRPALAGQQVLQMRNNLSGHRREFFRLTPYPDFLPSRE